MREPGGTGMRASRDRDGGCNRRGQGLGPQSCVMGGAAANKSSMPNSWL